MSYAPNAVIVEAPDPALTGETLKVGSQGVGASFNAGMGDAFPDTPFRALVWPNQAFPILGTNAEELDVTHVENDVFTLVRGIPAIAIEAGLRIAALSNVPQYRLGDYVSLSDTISGGSAPFTFRMRDPQGYSYTESRTGVDWAGSAGAGHLARQGVYHYDWSDVSGKRSSEHGFFIRFSDVG